MADVMKFPKLRGRIREMLGTEAALAKALGVSTQIVSRKLNGACQFKAKDIEQWCEVLEIPLKDAGLYFFI